jgi:hypothetical protein
VPTGREAAVPTGREAAVPTAVGMGEDAPMGTATEGSA